METQAKINAEKKEAREKKAKEEREARMRRQSQYMVDEAKQIEEEKQGSRTGDALKDFDLDLKKVSSPEATKYIRLGREHTYELIELLYRTDWELEKKADGVKTYSLNVGVGTFMRYETKYEKVTMHELVEYFVDIDKRLAWEGQVFDSIEEVRSYPLSTSMLYIRFKNTFT